MQQLASAGTEVGVDVAVVFSPGLSEHVVSIIIKESDAFLEDPQVGREARLARVLVELLVLVGDLRSDLRRPPPVRVGQPAPHLELHPVGVAHLERPHHASASACARGVAEHHCLVVVEGLDLEQRVGAPVFVEGLGVAEHESLALDLVDLVKLGEEVPEALALTVGVAFDVGVVDLREHLLHGLDALLEGLLEARAVEDQVAHLPPLLVDGRVLLDGRDGLGELAAAYEELAVQLALGPVLGEELGEEEAVAVAGVHH